METSVVDETDLSEDKSETGNFRIDPKFQIELGDTRTSERSRWDSWEVVGVLTRGGARSGVVRINLERHYCKPYEREQVAGKRQK